jgi:hypothetical protein
LLPGTWFSNFALPVLQTFPVEANGFRKFFLEALFGTIIVADSGPTLARRFDGPPSNILARTFCAILPTDGKVRPAFSTERPE